MEAGELARAAELEKEHDTALAEGPQGPLTLTLIGPHGGLGAAPPLGYDKISNFNADTKMFDVKPDDGSGSASLSICYRASQSNSLPLSLPEPLSLDALPTTLDTSGAAFKEGSQRTSELNDLNENEVISNSPSSTSGLAASIEAQSKATESNQEVADADADAAGGQYPVDGSKQTADSAAEEAEVEQSDSGQNKVNERVKRKFDDLDVVHSSDVSSRRDVTIEMKPVSELDEVSTEFSTLHTAERSINLFREI